MKIRLIIFLLFSVLIIAQTEKTKITGSISYLSSQNVYVKFEDPSLLAEGDTLFMSTQNGLVPAVKVQYLSSTSCAGEKLFDGELKVGMEVSAFVKIHVVDDKLSVKEEVDLEGEVNPVELEQNSGKAKTETSKIFGRASVSAYSNLSNRKGSSDFQRWRYLLSLNGENLFNEKVNFESYITFSYRADEWNTVSDNFGRALRIYSLAFNYQVNERLSFSVGRKINKRISNVGAFDGVNAEYITGSYFGGLILGSRPNFSDYGLNSKLFEFGGYFGRTDTLGSGLMENTISVIEQTNNFKTDRRYLYFQHTNNIIQKLSFFISSEVDLYQKRLGVEESKFDVTSIYFMTRYAPERWLSLSASYDARKNVIYYETYKSFADSLLDRETRQGFRFRLTLRPINYLFVSGSFGYRFKENDISDSKNYGLNISYSRIPVLDLSSSINFTRLMTNYLDGNIYGIRLNKQITREINFGIQYRKVNYDFISSNYQLNQNIFGADLSVRAFGNLILSLNYEGTFEETSSYGRIFANVTTRF